MSDKNTSAETRLTEKELHPLRIKVCGMTRLDQLQELGDLGVEFAGMIFYHRSPRFVLRTLSGADVRRAKLKVYKVGVFVNASYDEVMNFVDTFGLDLVQLHGDETPRFCEQISSYISVIKAFRLSPDDPVEWKIRDYHDVADMYLFDTLGAGYGGTGKKFDWSLLKNAEIRKPFFLSGGIEAADVSAIQRFRTEEVAKNLFALDINSCFETVPGVKDMALIREFVKSVKQ